MSEEKELTVEELQEKARKKNKKDKKKIQELAKWYKTLALHLIDIIICETKVHDYIDIIFGRNTANILTIKTNVDVPKCMYTLNYLTGGTGTSIEFDIHGNDVKVQGEYFMDTILIQDLMKVDPRAFKKMKKLFEGVKGIDVTVDCYDARVRMYIPD